MDTLGIFVKQPVAGKVKTRLAAEIGESAVTECYAAFVRDLVEIFQTTGDDRFLCYAPANGESEAYFQTLAENNYQLWPQPESILGARLQQFFDDSFTNNSQRVIVIGSDSPSLPVEVVSSAFDQLQHVDCVIGPATDGGYYLLGQRAESRPLFDDINWSKPTVFLDTIALMKQLKLTYAILPPWYDIDTQADLTLLAGHLAALRESTGWNQSTLTHTWQVLTALNLVE